jgi:hypothetical protein
MNTFAANCDRDDLNVCKRARENGRSHQLEICGVAEMAVMQESRSAPRNSVTAMSRLAPVNGGRLHGGLGQLLPRFLKAPLIARRVHDICRGAAAAREQRFARSGGDRHRRRRERQKQFQRISHVVLPGISKRAIPLK